MLLDQMNGDDAELTAQRAAADREWTYGHIVVDEAQELTAMDWRMLIRRCPSRSFTIVGDVAQTSALGGTRRWSKSMNRLFGESHWDLNELTINYRNPQEVSELASRFAEEEGLYISTVNAVRTIPDSVSRNVVPDMSSLLETTAEQAAQLAEQFVSADGTGRIAVICPDNLIAPVRDAVRRKLAVILDPAEYARLIEQPEWDEQISVCGTETVKGLEFDAVVVVEPVSSRMTREPPGRRLGPVRGNDQADPETGYSSDKSGRKVPEHLRYEACPKHCYWKTFTPMRPNRCVIAVSKSRP